MTESLQIRGPLTDADRQAALDFLRAQHYLTPVSDADDVFGAFHDGEVVGVVRLATEHGVTVLRGMRVRDDLWGRRIGRRLLAHLAGVLDQRECYCIPYRWLTGFYGSIGFRLATPEERPHFLQERLRQYVARGLDVVVMIKPAKPLG